MSSVTGKVALITGGANGIGEEVGRRLHDKGAKLVLTDLDEGALEKVAARLGTDRVLTAVADVRDLAAMQSAVDQGIERRGYVLIVSSAAAYAPSAGMVAYDTSKAGVEHFANALRLELMHRGVDVGSAHMLWIDTPLVREGKAESAAFREMLRRLPGPLGKTTSVEKCGELFVKGIENRKRQINCPEWVGLMRWLKPVLSSRFGERASVRSAPELLPQMDAEVVALGRSMSARTEALENR